MRSKERYFNVKKTAETLKNAFNRISDKTKLNPKLLAIVLLLIAGVAALMLSELTVENESVLAEVTTTDAAVDTREYEKELENRLVSIISVIDGAGETKVMVTLESGSEEVYLSDFDYGESIGSDGDNSFERKDDYVIVDGSSGQEGIVVRIAEPKVRGVAVVCKGAGSETVRLQIIETVTALLDISSARVSVAKMN